MMKLRDVLGHDTDDDSDMDTREVEQSLLISDDSTNKEDITNVDALSDNAPSSPDALPAVSSRMGTPDPSGSNGLARPFLHPNVSRLRSYTPQSSRISSTNVLFI
ncbi:uncharacterized protein BT62DRAFT_648065 [Guyanagaster necrorhizus]|uniref:Uncharacterized protein n=1 Tax=Guyanagaster necrorhizus TaxID=856835 RepID=A0A9P7VGB1_9AGAR|nr:uncharacterized protein BT62DRAFT_648065 [Guyanagaster necrorhizus MCA 3950]KAG7440042.1 hypothetical protein BT62DRAFT_648065 [Guyanagaster necrorhizus MCA 3950]